MCDLTAIICAAQCNAIQRIAIFFASSARAPTSLQIGVFCTTGWRRCSSWALNSTARQRSGRAGSTSLRPSRWVHSICCASASHCCIACWRPLGVLCTVGREQKLIGCVCCSSRQQSASVGAAARPLSFNLVYLRYVAVLKSTSTHTPAHTAVPRCHEALKRESLLRCRRWRGIAACRRWPAAPRFCCSTGKAPELCRERT